MLAVETTEDFQYRYPDFRDFLYEVWHHAVPGRLDPSWLQLDIAHELAVGEKRIIIEAFRGIGKSWITVAFVCYLLACHPAWNILVVSASKASADEFSTFTLRLIREMPDLIWMAPQGDERDSKIAFDVHGSGAAKAPSVKSLGITSQLTGSRADIIIADDIEIPSNSLTPGMRVRLSDQVREFDSILKPEEHARVIFLGTPQTEDSIYNKLQARGYIARIWPSRYPTAEECEEYGLRLAPSITKRLQAGGTTLPGTPTDPGRFGDMDLRERLISYGVSGYAMQFQLRTKLSDKERYPLKVHDLILMDCDKEKAPEKPIWSNDPSLRVNVLNNMAMEGDLFHRPMALIGTWLPYTGIVMTIDPSGRGADETGYCVMGMLNGYLYVLACGGLSGGYDDETLKTLAIIAKTYKVTQIIIEANFGDGMYSSLFTPILIKIYHVSIEEVKHSIQKERRMCDTLEPVIQGHRLVMDTSLIELDYKSLEPYPTETGYAYSLYYQMSRLTKEKGSLRHDDRLDALSMAVSYWVEHLSLDADKEQISHREALLDKELEDFRNHYLGINEGLDHEVWTPLMR